MVGANPVLVRSLETPKTTRVRMANRIRRSVRAVDHWITVCAVMDDRTEDDSSLAVALFPTCVVDGFRPEAGVAAVRVLRRLGCAVEVPDTTCCGQPAWNAGQVDAAAKVARTTLDALTASDAELVVVPAGSCATMMTVFWPELFDLAGDDDGAEAARALVPRVREFSVAVDGLTPEVALANEAGERVAYHRSCHMLRELRIVTEPERLLARAGVTPVPTGAEGRCCGFGGLFSVKLPEVSTAMADDVLDEVVAVGADEVVGCDASCLMHLEARSNERRLGLRFEHLAEVLERVATT
jgi:L-lactate dehydrogenase complex protein LldE